MPTNLTPVARKTRNNNLYALCDMRPSIPKGAVPASIRHQISLCGNRVVGLEGLSSAQASSTIPPQDSIWEILQSWGGEWMWTNLHFEDDEDTDLSWLATAMANGTTIWVTDGSYNKQLCSNLSGAGWIVYDKLTKRKFACSFSEWSVNAGSYRAELLGLCSLHLFMLAVQQAFNMQTSWEAEVSCDNEKALLKASGNPRRIQTGAKCPDLLRSLRNSKRDLHHHLRYTHVQAHMDDLLGWDQLSIHQQLNVYCDMLAKSAISRAMQLMADGSTTHQAPLPREFVCLFIGDNKITSDPAGDLRHFIGRQIAREFYTTDLRWSSDRFEQVYWEGLKNCSSSKSDKFRLWLTKQHSNFCATRKQLARQTRTSDDRCPSCIIHKEDAAHLCICPNQDRTLLLRDDTDKLALWLAEDHTHPELAYWIPKYILCRGRVRFADLGRMSPSMMQLAISQDIIGWREFMEGRISTHFHKIQEMHLTRVSSHMTAPQWASALISKILHITQSQWIFRNFMLHNKSHGYLRMSRQLDILMEIEQLMEVSQDEVPEDRQFLLEFDIHELSSWDFDTQEYWVHSLKAARTAQTGIVQDQLGIPNTLMPSQPRRNRRPWESSWGITQVLEQIRQEVGSLQGCTSDWECLLARPPRSSESEASFAL